MQWIGPRLKHLKEFAAQRHLDIRQLDTQLQFWQWELHNDPAYRNVLAHMAAARGRAKADIVFEESESGGAASLEQYHAGHTSRYDPILSAPPVSASVGKQASVVQNNKTDINIQHGPNAASTAAAVASTQDQVHREAVRTMRQAPIR
jgi:phosphoribosylcarboxyaminoimidazole (NCAIR) mutase